MVPLDSVAMVVVQFNFSNVNIIPASVRHLVHETPKEHTERKDRATGVLVVQPTEKCSLVEFLGELETAGYELVDAVYMERLNPNSKGPNKTYHMLRFLFGRVESAKISDEFKAVRDLILEDLHTICKNAMWRVRVFNNPYYRNGEEIAEQRTLSVNLEIRQPYESNGQPIMARQKDKDGKLSDAPLPLRPDYCLRIRENAVSLMTA